MHYYNQGEKETPQNRKTKIETVPEPNEKNRNAKAFFFFGKNKNKSLAPVLIFCVFYVFFIFSISAFFWHFTIFVFRLSFVSLVFPHSSSLTSTLLCVAYTLTSNLLMTLSLH